MSHRLRVFTAAAFAATLAASCSPPRTACGNGKLEGSEQCDDGNATDGDGCESDCTPTPDASVCGNAVQEGSEQCDDGNATGGDGCEKDCTLSVGPRCGNGAPEGSEQCDDGNATPGDGCENDCTFTAGSVRTCPGASLPPPAVGTCEVTSGDANRLFTGVVLAPGEVLLGGQVLFDATGALVCVDCDCSTAAGAATATRVTCPKGVISPGLINSHDHITFQAAPYVSTSQERYEHRHDWRVGRDGHTRISSGGSASNAMIRWAELRQVMAGTTSVAGSGGQAGLLRNLDRAALLEGLGGSAARYETFPLGDSNGTELTSSCGYPSIVLPSVIPATAAFLPHIAEGIEASARNEFGCLSSNASGGQDLIGPRTAVIHGIGLKAVDIAQMASEGAGLIWSPRSNVMLYGDTAAVGVYRRLGVPVALGTDWVRSGSMNLLRELRCADSLNRDYLGRPFTDEQLWRLVTEAAADVTQTSDKLGRLAAGKLADLVIFRQKETHTHRSVLEANPEDVVLTVRGGKVLYGDQPLVAALSTDTCDALDVCGVQKTVCLMSETNETLADLTAANAATYPLFFCNGPPQNEPSCVPERAASNVKNGSTTYSGAQAAGDADGDGVADAQDNCPNAFNPVRPMDNGVQADQDVDGMGDACDVCPLNASSASCTPADPNDADGDGTPNATDNCPVDHNPTQVDADNDGKGDACDVCLAPNPGAAPCPATIYQLKSGTALLGQRVSVGNALVTAVSPNGFFLQVHESEAGYAGRDHSGIFVFLPARTVSAGDRVNVSAALTSFFGQLQLSSATVTTASTGNPLPSLTTALPAEVATGGTRASALEAVLVQVANVTVTNLAPAPGPGDTAPTYEFEVTGGLRVNDFLYRVAPFPAQGEQFASVAGVLRWANGHSKLEPRSSADFSGGAPALVGFGPAMSFIRQGATGTTIPAPLTVTLSRVAATDVTVQVSSASTDVAVANVGAVTVPAGQASAPVSLTGVTQNAGVVLTATLGTTSLNATVRVVGAAEVARLDALDPPTTGVTAGGSTTFTVRLDLPAPAGGSAVALALSPVAFGTVPATVVVPQDQLAASFQLTAAAAATGSATLTASLGADVQAATATIQASTGLVINEYDYDQVSGDTGELVEIYNPTSSPVDLTDLALVFINGAAGANNAEYYPAGGTNRVMLATAGPVLAPGQYLVVGLAAVTGALPSGTLSITLSGSSIMQNGNPDAVGILDTVKDVLLDSLSYGGAVNAVNLGGTTYDFLEGTASTSTLVDSNTVAGSLSRRPNGVDTNVNATDFVFTPNVTPGAANN
ncbi:MAG: DUF4215 domain-containing protein [Myxococcota bacterium]